MHATAVQIGTKAGAQKRSMLCGEWVEPVAYEEHTVEPSPPNSYRNLPAVSGNLGPIPV
jgi:hypothetical protein